VTFDQAEFQVRCEWGLAGLRALGPVSDVVVIVDVLSFTTAIDIATARGGAVFPYPLKGESAASYAESLDAEHAAMVKVLGSKIGPELDAYYTKDMARTEGSLIQIYQSQGADNDRDIAAYAQSVLPQEEQHGKLAESLADSTARQAT